MPDKNAEILVEAAARNLAAVLSLPSAGMLRNLKSRLLGELDGGILVQATRETRLLVEDLIRSQTPCVVSFRSGTMRIVFAAPIIRAESNWRINSDTVVEAVLLKFPTKIQAAQKRHDYRVEIPQYTDISARVWRVAPRDHFKSTPQPAAELKTEIRDISTGGMGVKMTGAGGEAPKVCSDDRLRIDLRYNNATLILEGQMRKASSSGGDWIVTGIHFNKLENDLEGRQTLSKLIRIVGEIQRSALREARLGLTKVAS